MFTTVELKDVISPYAKVIVDEGEMVCDWRNPVAKKFSKLPGIRSQHAFVFSTKRSGSVEAEVRDLCYSGPFEQSASHVLRGRDESECIIPDSVDHSYSSLGYTRSLTDSKLKHLKQMYRDLIPTDRRLHFLD